jgi:hypothetical protein
MGAGSSFLLIHVISRFLYQHSSWRKTHGRYAAAKINPRLSLSSPMKKSCSISFHRIIVARSETPHPVQLSIWYRLDVPWLPIYAGTQADAPLGRVKLRVRDLCHRNRFGARDLPRDESCLLCNGIPNSCPIGIESLLQNKKIAVLEPTRPQRCSKVRSLRFQHPKSELARGIS